MMTERSSTLRVLLVALLLFGGPLLAGALFGSPFLRLAGLVSVLAFIWLVRKAGMEAAKYGTMDLTAPHSGVVDSAAASRPVGIDGMSGTDGGGAGGLGGAGGAGGGAAGGGGGGVSQLPCANIRVARRGGDLAQRDASQC